MYILSYRKPALFTKLSFSHIHSTFRELSIAASLVNLRTANHELSVIAKNDLNLVQQQQ